MTGPASLYVGRTTHRRFEPRPHAFSYGLFQILVDIDHVDEALRGPRLIRHGRFGVFSFAERDHGARDGQPLRPWVEARLAVAGIVAAARRIDLLSFPRVLGFVFNPLSIFFVHGDDDRLEAVIYEVRNTFGQDHAYVAPAAGVACERHEAAKAFYVSPFFGVEGRYRFKIAPPGERFRLVIDKSVDGRADFTAALSLRREPLSDWTLLRLFFGMPLMTLGVVAAIHWQALRLWLKGARMTTRPVGPRSSMSIGRATS